MFSLEDSSQNTGIISQSHSGNYGECKINDVTSSFDNILHDYNGSPEQVDIKKNMSDKYLNNGDVNEKLLDQDVDILINSTYEAKHLKLSAKADTIVIKEADSSTQLELNEHHINYYNQIQQEQQSYDEIHQIDLFFYNMAKKTKLLPQVYQAEIKRTVLQIVTQAEEKMYKNLSYK